MLGPGDDAVSVIIGQAVRAGFEDDYLTWQKRAHSAASRYPGYVGCELQAPSGGQKDWVGVYRFDSVANAQNWINSETRQALLNEAAEMFAGPGTRQVVARSTKANDALVTVVVTHRVPEEKAEEFQAWQREITAAESKFPGFRGAEVFRPVRGLQDEWTICYRFANAESLDAWLTSDARKQFLRHPHFRDFKMRKIDHSFGNWFVFGEQSAAPPSDFKTAVAVWMGLYPTVMLLTLLITPFHMPLWAAMLVGNLLSSFAMSYVTMPYYGNPILGWWLKPKPDAAQPGTNVRGIALVLLVNAAWVGVFYLVTIRFWHLQ
ncbi:antibiotic biosynthesis monooxygenase [Mycobacterium basiliense]|nr:antibiotic biosynthesis monooxygenase [Mycobacterium basiliense]